jgi:hypothetical protein
MDCILNNIINRNSLLRHSVQLGPTSKIPMAATAMMYVENIAIKGNQMTLATVSRWRILHA